MLRQEGSRPVAPIWLGPNHPVSGRVPTGNTIVVSGHLRYISDQEVHFGSRSHTTPYRWQYTHTRARCAPPLEYRGQTLSQSTLSRMSYWIGVQALHIDKDLVNAIAQPMPVWKA